MAGATRPLVAALAGSLLVVGAVRTASAQPAARMSLAPVVRQASSSAPGSISGVVRDQAGLPVSNVVVSALGALTTIAVTDTDGHFQFSTLTPGPYLVRAHLAGYVAPKAQLIQVRASAEAVSSIALRREGGVLAAGLGIGIAEPAEPEPPAGAAAPASAPPPGGSATADESDTHTETAWRIRHARRGVLKDVTLPESMLAEADDDAPVASVLGQIAGTSRGVASFFADAPLSGQVNLLTAGSFDTPQQLFSADGLARNVANVRLGAPAGDRADWTVSGALTQADISSWVVAGAYSMRAAGRHRYDVGLSYSTQRYDGGNPLALRDVTDGSRNVGTVYGFDSLAITPELTVSFGAEYAHYDYLKRSSLFSPRVGLTLSPGASTRIALAASQRATAPGAEEFLPPGDAGIWLPPQRTFSSFMPNHGFVAERNRTASAGIERDLGTTTIGVRAFRQQVHNPLVTVFGAETPGQPTAKVGHYQVGNAGDLDVQGVSAEFRAVIASRVHGSVEYAMARGQILRSGDEYLMLLAPMGARQDRSTVQDVTARIEADVPETATRVMVLYRVGNGFAQAGAPLPADARPSLDGRFDVQVRQSLPFMNFSNARWEMILAVRNFFRDPTIEQSLFDELLVVNPPKRVVGGVTLHF